MGWNGLGHTKWTHGQLRILRRFSEVFHSVRFSSKFPAKRLLKIPPHLTSVTCEALMSENDRQSQTPSALMNRKLQGTVVTYLRCGGIVNNQIKTGLLGSQRNSF